MVNTYRILHRIKVCIIDLSKTSFLSRKIWRIKKPTKIIKGTRDIHLSKTPLFYCSIYCITAWGNSDKGGTGAPSDNGYTKIYSTMGAFAALKADGSITAWGNSDWGGTGAVPPLSELPHAVIDPSALRAAKAFPVE
jgi:diketogulonate reductase-like aldo/keto reductase